MIPPMKEEARKLRHDRHTGNGWDIVSKYIEIQDLHNAKNAIYMPRS